MAALQTMASVVLLLLGRFAWLASCEPPACPGGPGQCTGSSLLQKNFASSKMEAKSSMRSDDVSHHLKEEALSGLPRLNLVNARIPVETEVQYNAPGRDPLDRDAHNKCVANSPDGRLFLCGESYKYVRYFKWEDMKWTDRGLPKFDDSTWALWTDYTTLSGVVGVNSATWCWPNMSAPVKVLDNGDHQYIMYYVTRTDRYELNITITKPMTAQAEIIDVSLGEPWPFAPEFGKYGYFSGDGKLWVGVKFHGSDLIYMALPEDAEPCSACNLAWSSPRPLQEMYYDPDGLNLRNRYGVAKKKMKDCLGIEFNSTYHPTGKYSWLDLEAKNLWVGALGSTRVIGDDTLGIEYELDGALNSATSQHTRFMSSFNWNFEFERTKAQRYPHEIHSSGVGSGATRMLPVDTGHHTYTMIDALGEYYTEPSLADNWKAQHWDIVWLPMSPPFFRGEPRTPTGDMRDVPDYSGHFFHGKMIGPNMEFNMRNLLQPWRVSAKGQAVSIREGVIKVDFDPSKINGKDIMGLTKPTRGFTAHISMRTFNDDLIEKSYLISHPGLELVAQNGALEWRFKDILVYGGNYEKQVWTHLALVFDGVDGTLTSYQDGVPVVTIHDLKAKVGHDITEFQLDPAAPLYIGNNIDSNFAAASPDHGYKGMVDGFRLFGHARSHRNICKSSLGADCASEISFIPTSTQYEIGMQLPECTKDTLHTNGCYAAIHRVCANEVAAREKKAGTSSVVLDALTPPGAPVSMGGVPVALTTKDGRDAVTVACNPYDLPDKHLSVAVEWHHMNYFHKGCSIVSDHSTSAFPCNLASRQFCKAAAGPNSGTTIQDPTTVTGIIFEAEFRAWVTCFPAKQVLPPVTVSDMVNCSTDLESSECQFEVAGLCAAQGHQAGLIQEVSQDSATVTIHCFDAASIIGLHDFVF